MLFKKEDQKTVLDGLDKALEILQKRYEKKIITIDEFTKKCEELGKKRQKYLKKLERKR